ncbi:MAG: hypothetical protein R3E86_01735 [Pseudomonadales bacterium]
MVIAGKEYGTGSSRDWAAKGTRLLGVKAVLAESFERIHRSNLIGMGVLPPGVRATSIAAPGTGRRRDQPMCCTAAAGGCQSRPPGSGTGPRNQAATRATPDSGDEPPRYRQRDRYFKAGGILQYVLNNLVQQAG